MPLSNPTSIFGIQGFTPYSRVTGEAYGMIRVLSGASISLSGELVELTGGSNPYAWDAQPGLITAELSFKPKEIPPFLFQILLGKTPTELLANAGNVTALANVLNASVFDATTGIASVGVKSGSEADLKFSKYLVKAASPTTVDVYAYNNVDFFRGADKAYEDDLLKITASPLTITTGGVAVEVPGFGVELIGGSGTIGMTTGDTADFEANPPSTKQMDVVVGETGICVPEFSAIIASQKKSNGEMWLFDVFRILAIGMPIGMEQNAYGESEITAKIMYDSTKNGIMKTRWIAPSSGCN